MFADDTNLSTSGISPADIENKINDDLRNVNSWLVTNKLTLNIKKTEFMLIASKRKLKQFTETSDVVIGRHSIKQVINKKVLWITLDDELKWYEHNDEQCKKISKSICLLRKSKQYVNQNALINIYNALVLPLFIYCSNVWNDGSHSHLNKLYKLQKRAARIITGSSYDIRTKEIFDHLEWEPKENILKKREISMTFKALKRQLPEYISDMFTVTNNATYSLRSNDRKLHSNKPNTDFMKKSFSYRAAFAWNNLPCDVVSDYESLSIARFKNLINNYFKILEDGN